MAAPDVQPPLRRWAARLGWLVAYWVAGVAVLALVAAGLRGVMRLVGLA